ncbi:MAG: hypothetical protein VYA30_05045 [Myxococcota bacterium]|nr:hypothetical protein [Myxococcota bacterium]
MRIETVVIRHPKERLSKCSLTPLHDREEIQFYKAKQGFEFNADGYTLLAVDAPALSVADAGRPLLLLDATWRLLPRVKAAVVGDPIARSIPAGVTTAYPRVGTTFPDPAGGLASVEALFIARALLGDYDESLLAAYHWREQFLADLPNWFDR